MGYKYKIIPVSPGETIIELTIAHKLEILDMMEKLECSIEEVNDLLSGKIAINNEIANKLEQIFDIPAQFFLNLEKNFRESLYNLYSEIRTEK